VKGERKTFSSKGAGYELDPSFAGNIIQELFNYQKDAENEANNANKRSANTDVIVSVGFGGRGRVLQIHAELLGPELLEFSQVCDLDYKENGNLEFRIDENPECLVPSEKLHEIGRHYSKA
jgi:hypothetical protein